MNEISHYDAQHWTQLVEFMTHENGPVSVKPELVTSITPLYGKEKGCTIWTAQNAIACDCAPDIARSKINSALSAGIYRHRRHREELAIRLKQISLKQSNTLTEQIPDAE